MALKRTYFWSKLRSLKTRAPIAREIFRTLSGLWWVGGVKCFCTNIGLPSRSMLYLGPYTDPERGKTIKYDVKYCQELKFKLCTVIWKILILAGKLVRF